MAPFRVVPALPPVSSPEKHNFYHLLADYTVKTAFIFYILCIAILGSSLRNHAYIAISSDQSVFFRSSFTVGVWV
jgi:hypothetical protein